jgi:histidine triad (HIT) family protein
VVVAWLGRDRRRPVPDQSLFPSASCAHDAPAGLSGLRDVAETIARMTQSATPTARVCIFCAIAAKQAEASVVFEDETVVAFMDLNPVTPGHLLVVPRSHAVGLEDLDRATSAHVWSVGHDMARALRRSSMRCEGINVLLCDGEAAFQSVPHFHLHVIPRFVGDGWVLMADSPERERSLLDGDARAIKDAIASAN